MLSPQQARIHAFKVIPALPEPLEPLLEIARNLWWSWNPDAVDLFQRISADLWSKYAHNPVMLLGSCPQSRLEKLATSESYLASLRKVHQSFQEHMQNPGWFETKYPNDQDACIAYFCAEFGLTECLRIYSGGLGILAGDHLKSAAELGLPLVGVGLLYSNGYFQQYLNADGWQQEFYPELDVANLPIRPLHAENGEELAVSVELPGRTLHIAVWEARVGRVRLFLLDTNLERNDPADRGITSQLYGGDMEMRIKQEVVLGIGGMRALRAKGIHPSVMHMNEGHAAFLALEHIRVLIEENDVGFEEARQAAAGAHVFTTHTPVPAGIDRFPPEMIQRYFRDYHHGLRLDMEGLLALGRENVFNKKEFFSMAVLALRTSDACNGVSKLHGEVSREMWSGIWPSVAPDEVPIGHVTNGVHARSWLSADLIWLYDRYLPTSWQTNPQDQTVWESIEQIPGDELWRIHERRRQSLVRWVAETHKKQLERRGASTAEITRATQMFKPNALTIGFARRFATYKRANLLFQEPDRLMRILANPERPVQIVIAGKAHPADTQGKELIREIVHFAREVGVLDRVVFIENYNMHVARYLVQGVDVWLNNPRRGMEASGTSGMKAALNGVLNCSIRDGWWDEVHETDVGWSIGRGETYANYDYQDQVESQSLYDLLEHHIVPLFYDRDSNGLPQRWVAWMKKCMQTQSPRFNTNRMVMEYAQQYYLPAHRRGRQLMDSGLGLAGELAAYVRQLRACWSGVRIEHIEADTSRPMGVREAMEIASVVQLHGLRPEMVRVQVYFGLLDSEGRIVQGRIVDMDPVDDLGGDRHRYRGQIMAANSGRHGFSVRVIPGHDLLATPHVPGLIAWDSEAKAEEPIESKPMEVTAT